MVNEMVELVEEHNEADAGSAHARARTGSMAWGSQAASQAAV